MHVVHVSHSVTLNCAPIVNAFTISGKGMQPNSEL